jgi:hypothetical protein
MKYAVEMSSGVVVYIDTKFHKDWFRHPKVYRGNTLTYRQHGNLINLLLFFENKESKQKWRTFSV